MIQPKATAGILPLDACRYLLSDYEVLEMIELENIQVLDKDDSEMTDRLEMQLSEQEAG